MARRIERKGGAPKGNDNAHRGKLFRDALKKELATYSNSKRRINKGQAARAIARKMILQGLDGDIQHIREMMDRVDGKVPHAVTGADDGPIEVVIRR